MKKNYLPFCFNLCFSITVLAFAQEQGQRFRSSLIIDRLKTTGVQAVDLVFLTAMLIGVFIILSGIFTLKKRLIVMVSRSLMEMR